MSVTQSELKKLQEKIELLEKIVELEEKLRILKDIQPAIIYVPQPYYPTYPTYPPYYITWSSKEATT
uniref:Uncharacterized protein n=1 Tax=viral metagenome TaxID=1070528 RepID=A0A6M3KVU6_9ZZZZ